MENISLEAFYGKKPPKLAILIRQLQIILAWSKEYRFIPHKLDQVRSTIIGCEGIKTEDKVVDIWFKKHRQEIRYIDFEGLVDYLPGRIILPPIIRFGGHDRDLDYGFFSRNKHPYHRSFQLQLAIQQTSRVAIGWS